MYMYLILGHSLYEANIRYEKERGYIHQYPIPIIGSLAKIHFTIEDFNDEKGPAMCLHIWGKYLDNGKRKSWLGAGQWLNVLCWKSKKKVMTEWRWMTVMPRWEKWLWEKLRLDLEFIAIERGLHGTVFALCLKYTFLIFPFLHLNILNKCRLRSTSLWHSGRSLSCPWETVWKQIFSSLPPCAFCHLRSWLFLVIFPILSLCFLYLENLHLDLQHRRELAISWWWPLLPLSFFQPLPCLVLLRSLLEF